MDVGEVDMQIAGQGNKIAEMKRAERAAKAQMLAGGGTPNMQAVDEAAQEFESVFLSQMLQHMFAGVDMNPMVDDGPGEEMYKSLLVDEYGKIISRAGGIGVADHVKREMLKLQEVGQ